MNDKSVALEYLAEGCVIPALPLVLNGDRSWNKQRQRALIRYYLASGAGGIAVAVHTTQFAIRLPEYALFEPLLHFVSEEIDDYCKKTGSVVIKIAGVCGETQQARQEALLAKECGYDAVLLTTVGVESLDEGALVKRTEAIAQIIPVIGFCMQKSIGGRHFSYQYWSAICGIENVVAIKVAPFNRYQSIDVARAAACSPRSKKITLYTGNDDNIIVDLLTPYVFEEAGKRYEISFKGGLLGQWAVWTKTAVSLLERLKKAREQKVISGELFTLAEQITDCNGAIFDVANDFKGCIAGVHEILRRQGFLEGIWCLNPTETLSVGQSEEIDRIYSMYPWLNDDVFVKSHLSTWLS